MAAHPTAIALLALSTLTPPLRAAIEESMRRDAIDHAGPIDPRRISITAHLRSVLEERGLLSEWRRHLYECAHGSKRIQNESLIDVRTEVTA